MSKEVLTQDYYLSSDVVFLAQDLLGKLIVTEFDGYLTSAIIVETEAYRAPDDRGSHAFGNKRTNRTEPIFLNGGITYIYLCYGIHNLFNVVTGAEGLAHCVLIRAVQPIDGISVMRDRRAMQQNDFHLTNGPGKWTIAMGIHRNHNATSVCHHHDAIRIVNQPAISQDMIISSERVGIAYAGEDALRPWRFRIRDNKWTSKPNVVRYNIMEFNSPYTS
jgi:DNA-3-methyladenine glycosylase